jgi:hypothetical protein
MLRSKFKSANNKWNDVRNKWATSLKDNVTTGATESFEMPEELWDGQASVHIINGRACVQLHGEDIKDGNVDTKI